MLFYTLFSLMIYMSVHGDTACVNVIMHQILPVNEKMHTDGNAYVEQLNMLSDAAFKEEFKKLDVRIRQSYLMHLDPDEYTQFLRRFKNKQEWRTYCESIPEHERQYLPSSWHKQLIMIRDLYYNLYHHNCFLHWVLCKRKLSEPHDLDYWKEQYYASKTTNGNRSHQLRDRTFELLKLKMFYAIHQRAKL